ncbi:MAG TPA: anti-sigma factor [Euzebya sp.]|nr:anti-sigma factor [Euzebya sp.]
MTDPRRPEDGTDQTSEALGDQQDALVALLADPAMWADPPPHVEDAVVAAITAQAASGGRAGEDHPGGTVREGPHRWGRSTIDSGRRWRPTAIGATLGVAAAMVLFLVAVGLDVVRVEAPAGPQPESVMVALAAAEQGPSDARAELQMQDMPNGLRIELAVTGLPPAPEDSWYELNLLRPEGPPVSAGSFHLRGGGSQVVLWAGIGVQPDLLFEITRQPEGIALLSGRL